MILACLDTQVGYGEAPGPLRRRLWHGGDIDVRVKADPEMSVVVDILDAWLVGMRSPRTSSSRP